MVQKVVLDTNILISALGWNGKPRQIFRNCIEGDLELIISSQQLEELVRVMNYPKFQFTQEEKEHFLNILLSMANLVEIRGNIQLIKEDPDDNVILETAIIGKVNYLISGDPHLLNLKEVMSIKIVTAAEFLDQTIF